MEMPPTKLNSFTAPQQQAVVARGNVLVMAGAGTGKTKTLVARCIHCLENDFDDSEPQPNIARLLVVTFTEAAAAEMRQRLGKSLLEKLAENPTDDYWQKEVAGIDLAHIGTLHSFCLRLVREHFHELGLDPQLALLDEGEARLQAQATLAELFLAHYEGKDPFSLAVQNLIQIQGGGRDEKIRALILQLHHYSQTRPDAGAWLAGQIEKFSASESADWLNWLLEAIENWRTEGRRRLEKLRAENEKAAELATVLSRLPKSFSREQAAEILEQIVAADGNWPARKKAVLRQPLGKFFDDAAFLATLAPVQNGNDPLVEDWRWVRGQMETLLRLAEAFAEKFTEAKAHQGGMDFHDLEQFALKLLWNFSTGEPTAVAARWRAKLKFVFVDEYQDINAAQDKIIEALSGGKAAPNRFLVGDVKQSIYRFRLADPTIFRNYAQQWRGETGTAIPLAENFRSREGLLNFVNSVCGMVLREEVGGVSYGDDVKLKFGEPEKRSDLGTAKDSQPRTELLLRRKAGKTEAREADDELADLDAAQTEARLVAVRLRQFVSHETNLVDTEENGERIFRQAQWRDVAILLRSPRGKSEIYAKEFERAGIPLTVARGSFYDSTEILDLLNLLRLLDNPLQDVPCIAVLRSPLVGLSLAELVAIRLAGKEKHFWTALNRFQNLESKTGGEGVRKIARFLGRFARWRKIARQVSLSQCLEGILAETLYADWLRTRPRGEHRAASVASLVNLAQHFDQFQRQGLLQFLNFIESQQAMEVEPEVPATTAENAVRLMSIHQSKGLEFPVVVLADLAKTFNEQDLRSEIILDGDLGLCPKVKPPASGGLYPSLPHWLAQRRQHRELRGEELRLLYVALTRARDNLILTASITEKVWEEKWLVPQAPTPQKIAEANSYAAWLALWFSNQPSAPGALATSAGKFECLRWRFVGDESLLVEPQLEKTLAEADSAWDEMVVKKIADRLAWNYPFTAATGRKAKSSVTALRREAEALDDEAEQLFPGASLPQSSFRRSGQTASSPRSALKLSASEIGAAHHKFLQHVTLDKITDVADEVQRLVRGNYLSANEAAALDLPALGKFWGSDLGRKIQAHAASVRRELPFTARFSPAEITKIIGGQTADGLAEEFVVVQGVADLVVLLPEEIWLVDFKTDFVDGAGIAGKIKTYTPQLQLYAAALEKVFTRPVTLRGLHFLTVGYTENV